MPKNEAAFSSNEKQMASDYLGCETIRFSGCYFRKNTSYYFSHHSIVSLYKDTQTAIPKETCLSILITTIVYPFVLVTGNAVEFDSNGNDEA
ncbi:hypothetical protein TNCV_1739661 [Trichonephila clavipes]|nr:hypothetical protein TNCV_1739661 [Trichonephila clavipes]